MTAKDLEAMSKTTRCSTCGYWVLDIGNLAAAKRLNDHLGLLQSHKCYECNADFFSEKHLQYHLRYSHDTVCTYCENYCGDRCSEKFGEAMCMDKRNEAAKKEVIADVEVEITNEVKMRISDEYIYAMEYITSMLDRGYDNSELAKLCSWIYRPTPMVSPKMIEYQVKEWMTLDNYEAAIDSQLEDAKKMQIEKCEYRSCGLLFVDIRLHYWQMHPEYIKPGMNQFNMNHGKEAGAEHPEVQRPDEISDPSVERHHGKPLDYQESNQDSRNGQTMETSVGNCNYSSMDREEKIETKYSSIRETQVETILTVNCQSKEPLMVFESAMGAMTDELGEIVNI